MKSSHKIVAWSVALIALIAVPIIAYQISHSFMAGYNVASGDYYLLLRDQSLLIDDPKLLQHYKYRITTHKKIVRSIFEDIFPIFKNDHNSDLVLMHRQTGRVKGLWSNQRYWAPESVKTRAKRLYRHETWHDKTQFAERLQQLKQIPGVSIRHADTPWQFEYVVTIRFPLALEVVTGEPYRKRLNPEQMLDELKTRLATDLAQHGVSHRLMAAKHFRVNDSRSREIALHRHYGLDPETRVSYNVSGYYGHVFVVRINCDARGLHALDSLRPLDWLHSPIDHDELIAKVKATVEAAGNTFDPAYTIANKPWVYTFDEAYSKHEEATEHAHLISGYVRNQPLSEFPVALGLSWNYDLERALSEPYPPELARAVL